MLARQTEQVLQHPLACQTEQVLQHPLARYTEQVLQHHLASHTEQVLQHHLARYDSVLSRVDFATSLSELCDFRPGNELAKVETWFTSTSGENGEWGRSRDRHGSENRRQSTRAHSPVPATRHPSTLIHVPTKLLWLRRVSTLCREC